MAATSSKQQKRVPSYRSRAGYSHALVTLTDSVTGKRRDYWLGPHGSPESREAYHRVLAEWEASGRRFPDDRLSGWRKPLEGGGALPPPPSARAGGVRTPDLITPIVGVEGSSRGTLIVNDLIAEYWRFAKGYYGGSSLYSIKMALRVLRELNGNTAAVSFGPNALRIVREAMILGRRDGERPREAWSRKTVNTRIGHLQRMFRCGAGFGPPCRVPRRRRRFAPGGSRCAARPGTRSQRRGGRGRGSR